MMQPIIDRIYAQMRFEEENQVLRAVQEIGVTVDKDRLIQALTDARAFYDEGYRDGVVNSAPVILCKDCKWFGEIGCAIRIVDDSDKPKENDFCSFGERGE